MQARVFHSLEQERLLGLWCSMFVCLFVSIDQATWFYGKPISRLLLVLPSVSLSVLVPF
jgi:hypothetical protein